MLVGPLQIFLVDASVCVRHQPLQQGTTVFLSQLLGWFDFSVDAEDLERFRQQAAEVVLVVTLQDANNGQPVEVPLDEALDAAAFLGISVFGPKPVQSAFLRFPNGDTVDFTQELRDLLGELDVGPDEGVLGGSDACLSIP